ncbi:MAG: hypothetical protein QHJ73_05170 [Armatimonadota bacterium]|nr:hypothetical protein [Armatimonadota bacterium]
MSSAQITGGGGGIAPVAGRVRRGALRGVRGRGLALGLLAALTVLALAQVPGVDRLEMLSYDLRLRARRGR